MHYPTPPSIEEVISGYEIECNGYEILFKKEDVNGAE